MKFAENVGRENENVYLLLKKKKKLGVQIVIYVLKCNLGENGVSKKR